MPDKKSHEVARCPNANHFAEIYRNVLRHLLNLIEKFIRARGSGSVRLLSWVWTPRGPWRYLRFVLTGWHLWDASRACAGSVRRRVRRNWGCAWLHLLLPVTICIFLFRIGEYAGGIAEQMIFKHTLFFSSRVLQVSIVLVDSFSIV